MRLSGSDTFIRCVSSPLQCWHWFRALSRTPAYFHLKSQHTLLSDIVLSIDLSQSCTHPTFYLRDSFKFRLCADLRLLGQYIIFRVPTSPSSLYTKKEHLSHLFIYPTLFHRLTLGVKPTGANPSSPLDGSEGPDSRSGLTGMALPNWPEWSISLSSLSLVENRCEFVWSNPEHEGSACPSPSPAQVS